MKLIVCHRMSSKDKNGTKGKDKVQKEKIKDIKKYGTPTYLCRAPRYT